MPIRTVVEYDLAKFHVGSRYYNFYEAERHLMDLFARLEAGCMVWLHVHSYSPARDYLGFTLRPDIWLQVIADDPDVAKEWWNVFKAQEDIL